MRIGSMGAQDDRRRLHARIAALRVIISMAFVLLLGGFWFFQVFQHAKFKEMAENNHQRTLPLRAPRGVIFDRNGEVLVENRASFNISIMREHTRDLDRTVRLLSAVTGVDEAEMRETVARHRREPSYRPIVVVQDATLAQVAAVTARRLDFELPDVVVQQVPTRRYPAQALGAHLLGYVGEASEQQVVDDQRGHRHGARPVGARAHLQPRADGRGRRAPRRRQQRGPRDPDARRGAARGGPARAAHDRCRDAAGRRRGLPHDRLLGLGGGARPAVGRRAHAREPAGLRPQRLCRRHRSRHLAGAQHRRTAPAAEPRHPGALFTGLDLQDRGGHGRPRRKVVTPDTKIYCAGGGTFYGRFFQCHLRGGHGWVDMRHALEKSCNIYFYTVGNMLGVDRIHEWSREAGPGGEERASICRTKWRASFRRPTGSSNAPASAGIRARRSRWRSARARCRSRRCRWR